MNQSGTLRHRISSGAVWEQLWLALRSRLFQVALSGNEVGRIGVFLALFILLILLPLTLLWLLVSLRPADYLLTFLAWLAFGSLCLWVGSKLAFLLHPEQLAYRQAIEACQQVVHEVSDQDILLDRLTHILYQNLSLENISVWRYRAEARTLELSRFQGRGIARPLAELPVDLEVKHLHGVWPVAMLPATALRRGLSAGAPRDCNT